MLVNLFYSYSWAPNFKNKTSANWDIDLTQLSKFDKQAIEEMNKQSNNHGNAKKHSRKKRGNQQMEIEGWRNTHICKNTDASGLKCSKILQLRRVKTLKRRSIWRGANGRLVKITAQIGYGCYGLHCEPPTMADSVLIGTQSAPCDDICARCKFQIYRFVLLF